MLYVSTFGMELNQSWSGLEILFGDVLKVKSSSPFETTKTPFITQENKERGSNCYQFHQSCMVTSIAASIAEKERGLLSLLRLWKEISFIVQEQ